MELRPNKLDNFICDKVLKNNIKIYIDSCKKTNNTLDHCLIYGLPGVGKTTLASIIAHELGKQIKIVQGNNIIKNTDIINLVLTLNEGDVLFIDEIHAINPKIIEILYTIMEDFYIDINIGKDFNSKLTRIKIPKFTVIGATTNLGLITKPLEDRFGIIINIKQYTHEQICKILINVSKKNKFTIDENDIKFIANNSRNIPRIAIRLLKRVIDFRIDKSDINIETIFKYLGINNGINEYDLKYLNFLANKFKPIGLKTISNSINIDEKTIENKIEPFLLTNHYIEKTNSGRIINEKWRKEFAK